MNRVLYPLAAIGGFCVLCCGTVLAAVVVNALTRRERHRQPPPAAIWHVNPPEQPLPREDVAALADRAFLASVGIDTDRTAERPYDWRQGGL